eukprot:10200306-Prorocentrum_lima.AAC.1
MWEPVSPGNPGGHTMTLWPRTEKLGCANAGARLVQSSLSVRGAGREKSAYNAMTNPQIGPIWSKSRRKSRMN